jgi:hypothetical protein
LSAPSGRFSTAGTRPEVELLLCCIQPSGDAERAARIRALIREGVDWAHVIDAALRHGIMPLLYQGIVATCPEAVPNAALDRLRKLFDDNARRNLLLTGELLKCLALLGRHGIPAVPYRGPVLAASVYGDFALRQFDDLDILVHEKDVLHARDLFVSQGFRPEFQLTPSQEAAYLRAQSEHKVIRDVDRVIVELHWRITERYFSFPLDTEQLWERLEATSLAGREVRSLSAEDLLLILCVHGTKHLWQRLEWICDVAKLLQSHEEMNWQWVTEQACMLGGERMLFLGLLLVDELQGAVLPEVVLQRVRADRVAASLAEQVLGRLLHDVDAPPADLEASLFHLKARERWMDRVRYCVRLAVTTTPGDWALVRLPSSLFPLYYVLRPIRLVGTYGPGLLRRVL